MTNGPSWWQIVGVVGAVYLSVGILVAVAENPYMGIQTVPYALAAMLPVMHFLLRRVEDV